jgi:LCP family protein required for cell wall assembly
VLLGGALSLAATLRAYERFRGRIDPAFPVVRPPPAIGRAARAVDVLLLGVDDVAGDSTETATAEAGMIALVHVPADRKAVHVLSLPHTTVVAMPGLGDRPLGSALALGGVPLTVHCVEQLVQVPVQHVAVVPLSSIAVLTDALGGVTVQNRSAFTSEGAAFPMGAQRLTGERAVQYVRSGGTADGARIDAEHAYLRGVMGVLLVGAPPAKGVLRAVSSELFPRLQVDPGLDAAVVARLALSLRNLRGEDVHLHRLPTDRAVTAAGDAVPRPRPEAVAALRRHLREDTLQDYRS